MTTLSTASHSLAERPWDQAYNNLRGGQESKLVQEYEKLISLDLKKGDHKSVITAPSLEGVENRIEQDDPEKRRSQMRGIVKIGLQKTEKQAESKRVMGAILGGVNSVRDIISAAIYSSPQAVIPWAVVTTALKSLPPIVEEGWTGRQSDHSVKRNEGTGLWLIESDEFQAWLQQRGKALFYYGIPGAGKTILTSVVVEEIGTRYYTDNTVGIAYVYCEFNQQGSLKPVDLFLSALKQLTEGLHFIPPDLEELYIRRRNERPTFADVLQEDIKTRIVEAANGMFLLANLHLDSLKGLGSAGIEYISSVVAGLFTLDGSSNQVRLVHYTTYDYLKRTLPCWYPLGNMEIARSCVIHFSFDTFGTGPCPDSKGLEERLRRNDLYYYAANNWGYHVSSSNIDGEDLLVKFLATEAKVSACIQAMKPRLSTPNQNEETPTDVIGLHLAAYYGLVKTIHGFINELPDIDLETKGDFNRTPLLVGAEMVNQLLDKGANPNSADCDFGWTALTKASEIRDAEVVKVLLDHKGVNIEAYDAYLAATALLIAVSGGHEISKLLLESGANSQAENNFGETLLDVAAQNGHLQIVKQTLDKFAN
ncbi:hypothetical protein UA08_03126 [Talaromyces atroroseus]|uniref:Uncharacterized protein n=1 Tax=Talaromyces atroroseus TaxID=1441469 RepID=A0A225B2Z6_TALAT|nr:hypothetical protein UA08_03126 [Talaromyces atroroseus]OKL61656.1 hypothetical protein UA08_03126 [Talaromyces atroroseus]